VRRGGGGSRFASGRRGLPRSGGPAGSTAWTSVGGGSALLGTLGASRFERGLYRPKFPLRGKTPPPSAPLAAALRVGLGGGGGVWWWALGWGSVEVARGSVAVAIGAAWVEAARGSVASAIGAAWVEVARRLRARARVGRGGGGSRFASGRRGLPRSGDRRGPPLGLRLAAAPPCWGPWGRRAPSGGCTAPKSPSGGRPRRPPLRLPLRFGWAWVGGGGFWWWAHGWGSVEAARGGSAASVSGPRGSRRRWLALRFRAPGPSPLRGTGGVHCLDFGWRRLRLVGDPGASRFERLLYRPKFPLRGKTPPPSAPLAAALRVGLGWGRWCLVMGARVGFGRCGSWFGGFCNWGCLGRGTCTAEPVLPHRSARRARRGPRWPSPSAGRPGAMAGGEGGEGPACDTGGPPWRASGRTSTPSTPKGA
jgi:hypothetical protein